ncbi:hypothetical protein [Dethiobacter alkaliphilus]|uniref:Uncharacterized protein n=1 Tax=Dethiobacter alkaliphilus AHT 1 TaxID=555088 RepID=C0GJ65_DETAL|nr:hypothetical protein [Dethiobacter alkaliphilus]EEG76550.1 hypothetical protein DealDRAFT_2524 [Dethiobacter alkaliphilus AHT 1]
MKLALTLLILTCLLAIPAKPAEAHQPRLVTEDTVTIKKPEVSQAFYGTLQGEPAKFLIDGQEEFNLFVSILVPDLPDSRRDFMVDVFRVNNEDATLLFGLDGKEYNWEPFFRTGLWADNYFSGGPRKKENCTRPGPLQIKWGTHPGTNSGKKTCLTGGGGRNLFLP